MDPQLLYVGSDGSSDVRQLYILFHHVCVHVCVWISPHVAMPQGMPLGSNPLCQHHF